MLLLRSPGLFNMVQHTQDIDNAAWTKADVTVGANVGTAPDGTATADSIIEDNVNTAHRVFFQGAGGFANAIYTASVYVKPLVGTRLLYFVTGDQSGTNSVQTFTDPATGTLSGQGVNGAGWTLISSSSQSVGSGWFRTWQTFKVSADWTLNIALWLSNAGATFYLGDNASSLLLWQPQIVPGSSPGPVIKG